MNCVKKLIPLYSFSLGILMPQGQHLDKFGNNQTKIIGEI
jgi:hypothetical protein